MAEVTKNVEDHQFEVHEDGKVVGHLEYTVGHHGDVSLTHTKVEEEYGGRGLAGELVRHAMDDIRTAGYRVRPLCSYVKTWLERNPGYDDLVISDAEGDDSVGESMEEITGVDPSSDPRI